MENRNFSRPYLQSNDRWDSVSINHRPRPIPESLHCHEDNLLAVNFSLQDATISRFPRGRHKDNALHFT